MMRLRWEESVSYQLKQPGTGVTPSGPLAMSGCSFFNAFWMMSGVISMCMIVGVTIVACVFSSTLKMVSSLASF